MTNALPQPTPTQQRPQQSRGGTAAAAAKTACGGCVTQQTLNAAVPWGDFAGCGGKGTTATAAAVHLRTPPLHVLERAFGGADQHHRLHPTEIAYVMVVGSSSGSAQQQQQQHDRKNGRTSRRNRRLFVTSERKPKYRLVVDDEDDGNDERCEAATQDPARDELSPSPYFCSPGTDSCGGKAKEIITSNNNNNNKGACGAEEEGRSSTAEAVDAAAHPRTWLDKDNAEGPEPQQQHQPRFKLVVE
jgi:hypothetical protein